MTVSAGVLRHHIQYSNWASMRLLDAAAELSPEELVRDFGTADRSVTGTLAHTFAAERIWLARVEGRAGGVPFLTEADLRMETIRGGWPRVQEGWRVWAETLRDEDAVRVLSYEDLSRRRWEQPLWQIVFHVVNHSTHHRGQVSGFLRTMGHKPPALDLIRFVRDRGAG